MDRVKLMLDNDFITIQVLDERSHVIGMVRGKLKEERVKKELITLGRAFPECWKNLADLLYYLRKPMNVWQIADIAKSMVKENREEVNPKIIREDE